LFVEVASSLGIHGVLHVDFPTTRSILAELGLSSKLLKGDHPKGEK
jgi:hypothetical protein